MKRGITRGGAACGVRLGSSGGARDESADEVTGNLRHLVALNCDEGATWTADKPI